MKVNKMYVRDENGNLVESKVIHGKDAFDQYESVGGGLPKEQFYKKLSKLADTDDIADAKEELEDKIAQQSEEIADKVGQIVDVVEGEDIPNYNIMQLKPLAETTKNGITYSIVDDEVRIHGTATSAMDFAISSVLPDGTYMINCELVSGSCDKNPSYTDGLKSNTFGKWTISSATRSKIAVTPSSGTFTNVVFHIWANEGTEKKPYQKYGESYKEDASITLKEDVVIPNFEAKVKEIVGITDDTIFAEEIADTVQKTFDNSLGQCLRFAYISDTHTYPNYDADDSSIKQYKAEIQHIKAVNEQIPFDFLLHCGDMVNTQWLWKEHTTSDVAYQKLVHDLTDELKESGIPNIFCTQGNHDGGFIPNASGIGAEYSSWKANYRAMQQQNSNNPIVVRNGINPFYYVDYPNLKLRCIFLATSMNNDSIDWKGIQYEEAVWMKNTLESIENDWNVLMFGHIPLNRWYTANKASGATQPFINICNGFCAHTTVDESGSSMDCDFTQKTGKILAYICGHYHGDSIVLPSDAKSVLEFPEVTIASGSYLGTGVITTGDYYDTNDSPTPRTYGTVNQDVWDSVVYNKTENKIYFTRFGAGNDRVLEL